MSRRCELTGKGAQVGHKVSHSNRKTKRRFLPNLLNVTLISDALGRSVKLRVSANALKTVDHRGGLDAFLLKAKDDELSTQGARAQAADRKKKKLAARQRDSRQRSASATRWLLCSRLRQRELQQQRALQEREIVVGDQREHGVAAGAAVNAQAFHIVDLISEIGLEQDRAVDQRVRLDVAERDAPDAHRKPGGPAEFALQHQQIAARQERGIADVEIGAAPDREAAGLGPPIRKRRDIAGLVEAALGNRDQRAGERQALAARTPGASMPLLVGSGPHAGRHRDRLPAREQAVLAVVEAHDLVDALDAHIERAAVLGERLGVVPAARRQRPAVGAEDRRHLGIRDADRPRALVDEAAAKPPALVGERDEMRAVGGDANGRNAAELPVRASVSTRPPRNSSSPN